MFLLTFFGGRAASGDQPDVPIGFYLPDPTLSSAMRGSRWPSHADLYCLDWNDSESFHWLLDVACMMCRLAECVALLPTEVLATVIMCRGKERYING